MLTLLNKAELRTIYRGKRNLLSAAFRTEAAELASHYLRELPQYQQAKSVACYLSYGSECITEPLIKMMWQAGKSVYLPILLQDQSLQFVLYREGDELHPNQFGILEPKNNLGIAESTKPDDERHKSSLLEPMGKLDLSEALPILDLVILPLLAFDLKGTRLGAGGGYYDRTFAGADKPFMLGYAYQAQLAGALPAEEWDVHLAAVLTEAGITTFHN